MYFRIYIWQNLLGLDEVDCEMFPDIECPVRPFLSLSHQNFHVVNQTPLKFSL